MPEADRYHDIFDETLRNQRITESAKHLKLIHDNQEMSGGRGILRSELREAPFKLVEVGPGMGGVIITLKATYPHAEIFAIDYDERAQAVLKKTDLVAEFHALDIFSLSDGQGRVLFGEAALVFVLRNSLQLGVHLLTKLKEWGFKGQLVFSWISQTDDRRFPAAVIYVRQLVRENKITVQPLVEGRAMNESAHVADFSQGLEVPPFQGEVK